MFDLSLFNGLKSLFVDDYLMKAGFDEAAGDVFDLFSGLDEEIVSRWNLDGDSVAGVSRPDVETWVARTAVDGQEVEICVEASQDGVELGIFVQIRRSRGEKMRSK